MSRIQKVSSYLLAIFNFLLIVLPLFSLSIWLFMDVEPIKSLIAEGLLFSPVETPEGTINISTIKWTHLSKFTSFMAILIGLLPLLAGLFVLKAVFRNYQKGEIFNAYNARHYRYLGWIFFLDAFIAEPLSHALMVLAVTLSNPPGHRIISITFGSPNIEALFCGILVIVISWIMVEGYKLQEEQKLII
ncbi:MAG: hypothetical protein ACD_16C00118G0010 [uncultured bacterium]|nr:MAG: hypothetical protein ACD_16C00118G0010 [uncultured bacterium]OFW67859.1 MAG: hypothetical protein A2X70_00350 [Alphaproteobacteria bacterium GWC2_42_16]OFW74775.1 MAG: hypothetical protein A2Z80_04000 [Alphaproteobacteria bacterium GWA2_41_27]OFW85014.1 MAG: hypothetical protein A3E50_02410 [Alphaproteobacteria bacterium RIFCSPHIGHO2_12_FULL_42_100]OFW86684.1 MAG: hypothetical protein A2W06_01575 [Alphaproteobacteria bacterium RBG_16_42_14]OFW92294.1 MAG: hypothetical protein A2W46_008